jgi:hypothetical protein
MPPTFSGDELIRRRGQWQSTQGVFDADLPGRNDAQVHLVHRVDESLASMRRKYPIVRRDPKKGARIQQDLQDPSP